jgi:hypothetical protein
MTTFMWCSINRTVTPEARISRTHIAVEMATPARRRRGRM